MKKLKAYYEIIRPVNLLITFLVVVVSGIISIGEISLPLKLIAAGFSASFTAAAGNVINDIFDVRIDRINRPLRPIPSGRIRIKEAVFYYTLLMATSIIISVAVSIGALIIVLLTNILLYYYSRSLKRISFIGNAAVSICTGLAFIFGGVAVGYVENSFLPAVFAFLINIIREIIKDVQDIEGDSLHSHQTLPIKFGISYTKKFLALFIIFLISFTFYPFFTGLYKIEYLIIVLFFVDLPLIYILKEIFSKDFFTKLSLISFKLKVLMIIGLFAIFLGRF